MSISDLKDKKPKEQEKRGDFLHRPLSRKLDKTLSSNRQPPASPVTQVPGTRVLLRDRKATKSGFPDKGGSAQPAPQATVPDCTAAVWPRDRHSSCACRPPVQRSSKQGWGQVGEGMVAWASRCPLLSWCADSFGCRNIFRKTSDSHCVASSSMEFIAVPLPRTPRVIKKAEPLQQGLGNSGVLPREDPLMLDMVRSFESVDRDDPLELLSPAPHCGALGSPGGSAHGNPGERVLSPTLLPGSPSPLQTPLHPTLVSFAHEDKSCPPKESGVYALSLIHI